MRRSVAQRIAARQCRYTRALQPRTTCAPSLGGLSDVTREGNRSGVARGLWLTAAAVLVVGGVVAALQRTRARTQPFTPVAPHAAGTGAASTTSRDPFRTIAPDTVP